MRIYDLLNASEVPQKIRSEESPGNSGLVTKKPLRDGAAFFSCLFQEDSVLLHNLSNQVIIGRVCYFQFYNIPYIGLAGRNVDHAVDVRCLP